MPARAATSFSDSVHVDQAMLPPATTSSVTAAAFAASQPSENTTAVAATALVPASIQLSAAQHRKPGRSISKDLSVRSPSLHLSALPDDVLLHIVRMVTHCHHDNPTHPPQNVVELRSYTSSVGIASVNRQFSELFYASLDNVTFATSHITDQEIDMLARRAAGALKRLVLRGSVNITNASLRSLAFNASLLRSIDLSFVQSVDASGLAPFCAAAGPRLHHILLRKCIGVDDDALRALAPCVNLHTVDVSYCPRVTDNGMRYFLEHGGRNLRFLAFAHDAALSDFTFEAVGMYCKNLVQLCARSLPFVTDIGFARLCRGVGHTIAGIDVTSCCSLTRESTLRSLRRFCRQVYFHIMPDSASRSLRQIIISTLRQNIFIVHGSDPNTGKDTVHTVLIDNGDIVSASLLSSGTTDLSLLGIVLCKSYGSKLSNETKQMLETDYGIPMTALAD